jgi:hypothetical protein
MGYLLYIDLVEAKIICQLPSMKKVSQHFLMTNMMMTVLHIVIIMSSTFLSSCQAGNKNCKLHHYFYFIQIFISNILGLINLTNKSFLICVFFKKICRPRLPPRRLLFVAGITTGTATTTTTVEMRTLQG